MKKHLSPKDKARYIASYKASGLSAKQFVAKEKLALSSFYQWLAIDFENSEKDKEVRMARVISAPINQNKKSDSYSNIKRWANPN